MCSLTTGQRWDWEKCPVYISHSRCRSGKSFWEPGSQTAAEQEPVWRVKKKLCLLELRRESPQKTIVGRGAAWGAGMKHPLPQVITSFCTAADALPLDDPAWGLAIPMEGGVQCHGAGCYSKPVTNLSGEPGSASNSFQPTLPCHLQANCGMCDFKGRINVFKVPVKPTAKTLTKKAQKHKRSPQKWAIFC